MGIINLTPDSFSDGGKNFDSATALANAQDMIKQGASYIDVGAESTRPGAETITPAEEWKRLENFLLVADSIPISLDTRNYETAKLALIYSKIKILNDVSGFNDKRLIALAATYDINVITMHSLTVPADRNITLQVPPVPALKEWINTKFKELTASGIKTERIIFDVGIGFGKTPAQSYELIAAAPELAAFCHNLGCRILYGHSRKSFLQAPESNKDIETARITAHLALAGVDFVRVHDIKSNLAALQGSY